MSLIVVVLFLSVFVRVECVTNSIIKDVRVAYAYCATVYVTINVAAIYSFTDSFPLLKRGL